MKKIVLGIVIILSVFRLQAQDSTFAREVIQNLSADAMYGRSFAHDGEALAAQYLIRNLHVTNLLPLAPSYKQTYMQNGFAMTGAVEVAANGKPLSARTDFSIAPYSRTINQECVVIPVNPQILLDQKKLAAFIHKNQDKLPGAFVAIDMTKVKTKEVKAAVSKLSKVNYFQSLGILFNMETLPVWSLNHGGTARNYAVIYLANNRKFKSIKKLQVKFNNILEERVSQNVAAYVKGTVAPDSFIVFTAHYDHLGCMGDSVIFPGAHDNASGTAAVLDLARHFALHPAAYSTAFLFFSGEEAGCVGSRYFVQHPLIPLDKIKLVVNLDLLGGGDEGIAVVNAQTAQTKPYFAELVRLNEHSHAVRMVKPRDNAANSDHYSFTQANVPAIFIYTMGGKIGGYHHWSDTSENCSLTHYEGIVQLLIDMVEKKSVR